MKGNKIFLSTLLSCLTCLVSNAQGVWTQKASLPAVARQNAVSFAIGTKVYLTTGSDINNNFPIDTWEYDPANDTWTQKANFPGGGRDRAVAFAIGNYGYVTTGYAGLGLNDLWQYDPVADTWTQKANILGQPRYGCFAFVINGKGYVGGGYTGSSYITQFHEYDPVTDVWTAKFGLAFAGTRAFAVGFAIGNYGYMSTGFNNVSKKDLWQYDPVADIWTQKVDFPGVARREAVGFAIGNYGYVGTGWQFMSPSSLSDFYRYDPSTDTWSSVTTFSGCERMYATATVLGNKAYLGTGDCDYLAVLQNDWWSFEAAVGIAENGNGLPPIQINPNPMTDEAKIILPNNTKEKIMVNIFDNSGKIVQQFSLDNNKEATIKRENLKSGTYEVVLTSAEGKTIATIKLVVK